MVVAVKHTHIGVPASRGAGGTPNFGGPLSLTLAYATTKFVIVFMSKQRLSRRRRMRQRRQQPPQSVVAKVEDIEMVPAADDRLSNGPDVSDEESIVEAAAYGECSLEEMMSMPTVLLRGVLNKDSKKGSVLYACSLAPRYIRDKTETRISYVSRLFRFWRGEISFRLRVTKSLYQEAKFLMVFVPGATPAVLRSTNVDSLISSQCSVIFAASNDEVVELCVPFYSTGNWQRTNEPTGAFGLVLADPLVSSSDTGGTINYTLECLSNSRDPLCFRYAMMPEIGSLPDTDAPGDSGGGVRPPNPDDPGQQPRVLLPETYRRSSRRTARAAYDMNEGWGLVDTLHLPSSVAPCQSTAHTCIPVGLNHVSRDPTKLAKKMSCVDLSPPFSFVSTTGVMSLTLVPYLPRTWRYFGTFADSTNIAREDGYARSQWYTNLEAQGMGVDSSPAMDGASWKHRVPEWNILLPTPELAQKFVDLKWGVLMVATRGAVDTIVRFEADSRSDSWLHLKYDWKSDYDKQTLLGIAYDSPLFWLDSPVSVHRFNSTGDMPVEQRWVTALTGASQHAPYPNINIYTSAWQRDGAPIQDWLNSNSDEPAPIEATGQTFGLSVSQCPRYFDMIEEVERGVFTWLFNVFSGNEESPWAKIARVADLIFEFCLPLLVGYDGSSPPVSVESGWRLDYEGLREDQLRRLPSCTTLRYLTDREHKPPQTCARVEEAVMSYATNLATRVRHSRERNLRKKGSQGRSVSRG